MFEQNEKTYRNLEEQVQYLTDLHEANKTLVSWGIKVVGQVETVEELPNPETYIGDYGDTYAVGLEAPFYFYIWTRSSLPGATEGYWFPFGEISIVGPQGPQGPQGEKGNQGESSKIYVEATSPQYLSTLKANDVWLQTSSTGKGNLYQYNGQNWILKGNITGPQGPQGPQGLQGLEGPQGPQGPKGERGDVGGLVNIAAILASTDLLPTPAEVNNVTIAYLIGTQSPYDLWIQVGLTPQDSIWTNTGPFNAATMVTSGGEYQNIWDADTKVNVPTQTPSRTAVYQIPAKNSNTGEMTVIEGYAFGAIENTVVIRAQNGLVNVADPVGGVNAVNYRWHMNKTPATIKMTINDTGYWGKNSGYVFETVIEKTPQTMDELISLLNLNYFSADIEASQSRVFTGKFLGTGAYGSDPINITSCEFGTASMYITGQATKVNNYTITVPKVYLFSQTKVIGLINEGTPGQIRNIDRIIENVQIEIEVNNLYLNQ